MRPEAPPPPPRGPLPVRAAVVRALDAPGPTLVLRVERLPVGALALRRELVEVCRAVPGIRKIALYGTGPAGLAYRFVQVLPAGRFDVRFDFRAGCGHSLLACVVADGRPGPVTVRAVTTGDTVLCAPEPGGPPDTYTLHFLRPPTAPGTLPTGRPVDVLDGVPVSLVRYGNPYVFVDARHLPDEGLRARLERLRAEAARLLGHPPHSALPKIAVVGAGPGGLAVRALTVGGWHPRLALTGAAALAAAGALDGTVVPPVDGEVRTPGGTVTVSVAPDRVRVHHKRAELLRRLEVPWRVHATA
ncbi:PrpF domain-containing protein [Streptomyces venezuelae]|uniref:PrpF domain-containing protein n=1 Tax=Streptomyces venezuelae TaxID=54571 RepID=UPI00123BE9F0|nr:PrpF domain-containing protein [Streptomyces venezuelae]